MFSNSLVCIFLLDHMMHPYPKILSTSQLTVLVATRIKLYTMLTYYSLFGHLHLLFKSDNLFCCVLEETTIYSNFAKMKQLPFSCVLYLYTGNKKRTTFFGDKIFFNFLNFYLILFVSTCYTWVMNALLFKVKIQKIVK